jgi:hypothetical protein
MVVRALPTGSLTSCNRQSSESGVVLDHIRLRQHEICTVTCHAPAKTPGYNAVVGWWARLPGYFYAIYDDEVLSDPADEIRTSPIETSFWSEELLPTVEDLIAASQGAIEWEGQEELVRDLIFDPYSRSRYTDGRIHALVGTSLRSLIRGLVMDGRTLVPLASGGRHECFILPYKLGDEIVYLSSDPRGSMRKLSGSVVLTQRRTACTDTCGSLRRTPSSGTDCHRGRVGVRPSLPLVHASYIRTLA